MNPDTATDSKGRDTSRASCALALGLAGEHTCNMESGEVEDATSCLVRAGGARKMWRAAEAAAGALDAAAQDKHGWLAP